MPVQQTPRRRPPHIPLAVAATVALSMAALVEAGPFRNPLRQRTTVERLAEKIDRLGKHIDEYGTVVPKHPDVWGDGRLTRHRVDIENELKKDLSTFEFRLNATVTESDSAFLGEALALSAIADGSTPLGAPADSKSPQTSSQTLALISSATSTNTAGADPSNIVIRRNPNDPVFYNSSPSAPSGSAKSGIALEPTLVLDQKNRYLQHLNELRRLNEGDDTADSPGYALHMVRFPVSILPGRKTSHGYGAEITMTATPHLSDELLPSTMRDLVINDIVDECTTLLARMASRSSVSIIESVLNAEVNTLEEVGSRVRAYNSFLEAASPLGSRFSPAEGAPAPIVPMTYSRAPHAQRTIRAPGPAMMAPAAGRPGLSTVPAIQTREEASLVLMKVAVEASKQLDADRRPSTPLSPLSVRSFLQREAAAAYRLLQSPDALHLWTQHCDDQLFSDLQYQRQIQIEERRWRFLCDLESIRDPSWTHLHEPDQQVKQVVSALNNPTSCLAWLIMVHSAKVNQSLKNDMREVAAHKNCPCVVGEHLSFVGPHPDPEAVAVFNEYVRCRWPVIVFALDPANQEQNIGLSSSRRREMQLVAAIAAARGRVSLQSLTRFVRRLEMDLATIDLNRTDIGFSHGNDTFGWRFRPRLQSPEIESNLKVATRDLLIGGPSHEHDLKSRKLEPGIRECTAVVLMPSFVPYVTFDSRANWFRLDNPDCCVYRTSKLLPVHARVMDLEDSVELSREITAVRSLSQACVQDAHLYRDGEVHRLVRSVEQLDRSLPLQTAYVQIPFDGDITPSDVFERGASGQAPRLEGWYGEPGIYVDGSLSARASASTRLSTIRTTIERLRVALVQARLDGKSADVITAIQTDLSNAQAAEAAALTDANQVAAAIVPKTTLFLVGKHFSLFNMQIMAGGVDITPSVVLMSRNLCQVSIPASVATTVEKDDSGKDIEVVDVHVATTYGLTSRLAIPVVKPIPPAKAAASANADDLKKLTDRVSKVENATISLTAAWNGDNKLKMSLDGNKVSGISLNDGSCGRDTKVVMYIKEDQKDSNPFSDRASPENLAFAAWLISQADTQDRAVIGPLKSKLVRDTAELTVGQLEDAIRDSLQKNPQLVAAVKPGSPVVFSLKGFLRFPDSNDRPTYPVTGSFLIRLSAVK